MGSTSRNKRRRYPTLFSFPVSDPFVGGGTVVLEAMRAGRLGVGADISPLALFVSRGRCWTAPDGELEGLREVRREE